MSHRGPDAEGFYWLDPAFGHHACRIIDLLDAANQPFEDESGRYTCSMTPYPAQPKPPDHPPVRRYGSNSGGLYPMGTESLQYLRECK